MIYCLINPSSRSRKGVRIWKKIEKDLKKECIAYQTIISKSKDDVTNAAKRLTRDSEEKTVIIIGGDGTLNSFLNGMERTDGICIGYLPVGSGNDFARGMGITANYREELELILHDRQKRHIYYGEVSYKSGRNQRFFVSSGIGYDAKVCYKVDHSPTKKILNFFQLGKLIYLVLGVLYLIKAKTFTADLFVDDELVLEGDKFLFTSFHVLPYEGGGFKFCPDQHPEDNRLHICAVQGIPRWKLPFIIPQALMGTHVNRKGVHIYCCDHATIQTGSPQYVHTDGETDHKYDGITVSISEEKITFLN
ncbi:MAG: YegS/Rv2252/BmrU family lipid kinase [Eubacteriales bacterium]|nr:YegS/Rv2252/BmrU family lipid kinase [Eubacteriales bacterium]